MLELISNYRYKVEYKDGKHKATSPDFAGLISEEEDPIKAIQRLQELILENVVSSIEDGKKPPKPAKRRTSRVASS